MALSERGPTTAAGLTWRGLVDSEAGLRVQGWPGGLREVGVGEVVGAGGGVEQTGNLPDTEERERAARWAQGWRWLSAWGEWIGQRRQRGATDY